MLIENTRSGKGKKLKLQNRNILESKILLQSVLEPFSKILSHCIQNSIVKHKVLNDLCSLSAKAFAKVSRLDLKIENV